jgi:hypothetical protein
MKTRRREPTGGFQFLALSAIVTLGSREREI